MPDLTFKQLARLSVEEKNSIKELGLTEIDLTDQDKLLEAFKGLTNLTLLEIDGLNLSSTSTKRTTRRQTTIRTENFTTLPAHIFDDLTNLKYLVISRLKLTALDENIFINLPNLEEIKLEELNLAIPVKELRIVREQTHVFKNKGIPKINLLNLFDVSRLADVIVLVHLIF